MENHTPPQFTPTVETEKPTPPSFSPTVEPERPTNVETPVKKVKAEKTEKQKEADKKKAELMRQKRAEKKSEREAEMRAKMEEEVRKKLEKEYANTSKSNIIEKPVSSSTRTHTSANEPPQRKREREPDNGPGFDTAHARPPHNMNQSFQKSQEDSDEDDDQGRQVYYHYKNTQNPNALPPSTPKGNLTNRHPPLKLTDLYYVG